MRLLAGAMVLLAAASLAAFAQAQDTSVTTLPEDPCVEVDDPACDTEFTPVPKPGEFDRIAGAQFGATYNEEKPLEGFTPFTVDFFGTDFRTDKEGFLVGDQCANTDTDFAGLETCDRAPAIYRYTTRPDGVFEIGQVYGPEQGDDDPGYVAAVAWIAPGRAIAVGGSGHYPRRELARGLQESDQEYADRDLAGTEPNAAGQARVWLYASGRWRELGEDELPRIKDGIASQCNPDTDPACKPMGGLTTVDCSPRKDADGELCLAGGFRQVWKWEEGAFTKAFTPSSAEDGSATVDDGAGWRFRVRQLRFTPGESLDLDRPVAAVAVTSGCCGQTRQQDSARVLIFDGDTWRSVLLFNDTELTGGQGANAGSTGQLPTSEQRAAIRSAYPSLTSPESFFALGPATGGPSFSVVLASGRPGSDSPEPEPRSAVVGYNDPTQGGIRGVSSSTARLVAADGDFGGPTDATRPDSLADWAVGVQRSSGQGLAYTTLRITTNNLPSPLTCDLLGVLTLRVPSPGDCQPSDANQELQKAKSGSLVAVDTYALNGFAFTPSGGAGWAVGDKGGIARVGGEGLDGSGSEETDPDRVGSKAPSTVTGASAYDGLAPGGGGEVGAVPPLAARPMVELPEPRLIPAGSPRPSSRNLDNYRVGSVVMSRDGSEGWAVAGVNGKPALAKQDILFHYDGVRWSVCDPEGIAGQVEPDPACAALAPLQRSKPAVQLRGAARVPLERDSDPTNDDEFEVVAVGTDYRPPGSSVARPVMLRYRDGRWSVDGQAMTEMFPTNPGGLGFEAHSVVFTAPGDGWAITGGTANRDLGVFHYDGTRWIRCNVQPTVCGADASQVLPLGNRDNATGSGRFILTAAGRRVYIAGTRKADDTAGGATYPFIASIDTDAPTPSWTRDYDPGCGQCEGADPAATGRLRSLSVIQDGDGRYRGWATGLFEQGALAPVLEPTGQPESDPVRAAGQGSGAALLRLDPGPDDPESGHWSSWSAGDAADDYLFAAANKAGFNCDHCGPGALTLPTEEGGQQAFITPPITEPAVQGLHPMLRFDEARCPTHPQQEGCWSVLPTPFTISEKSRSEPWGGVVAAPHAMAPDGQGGFWLATRQGRSPVPHPFDIFFYHYTDRAPAPVFSDAPHPIREEITAAAPGPSGELWVTTKSGIVYRYDRVLGWDRLPIKGWDRGNVITRTSQARAVAVGRDGTGVVVGEGGRIAQIGPAGVQLDPAAGVGCGASNVAPCTSGRDLTAAAVAPDDGSALVGGDGRALLWRAGGGQFQAISPPAEVPTNATITGISMPSSSVAYLSTSTGQVFRGAGPGPGWGWELEDLNGDDVPITLNAAEQGMRLNAISVDAAGHGYAVGEQGLLLERRPGAELPWRRVQSGVRNHLYSVTLSNGSGRGALIGGQLGLVLTEVDGRFEVARTDDATDPLTAGLPTAATGRIVGLGLSAGSSEGQVEAWAVSQVPTGLGQQTRDPDTPGAVLHYTNAPDEPLLDGGAGRAKPLPDTAAPSEDELTVAALGRSDCTPDSQEICRELQATTMLNETIASRAVDEILARSGEPGGPSLALFTGDVSHAAGRDDFGQPATPFDVDIMHRRWLELIGEKLRCGSPVGSDFGCDPARGLPLFGAIGSQDLSQVQTCAVPALVTGCVGTRQTAGAGTSEPWQQTFASQWPGWGASNDEQAHGGLDFKPLPAGGSDNGRARTHYAVDIERDGAPIARLIVIDNSLRSLAASDAQQNPTEEQQTWLTQTLCKRGSTQETAQTPCTREPGQRAIVLMNTPTYSYNTQASGGGVETAIDQASLESVLLTNQADAVVSGRLGWNGLYYTLAAALHFPCPGGRHPAPDGTDAPPPGNAPPCEQAAGTQPQLPALPGQEGQGSLPTLVASGAGGTFGPPSSPIDGDASDGFWHGYSLLHLNLGSGAVRVEQRPIFDWLGIRMPDGKPPIRSLRAKKKLQLEGFGREAAAADVSMRYDEIDSNAITHVYSLLAADPDRPWLPAEGQTGDGCDPYDCLPGNVGSIDEMTGLVTAGNGAYPRTYAVAELSAGEQSATYPLVFEPRASFRTAPPPPAAPVAVAPPPPPPAPAQPTTPQVNLPAAPVLPVLTAQALAPPPVPPTPPVVASQAPLDTNISPAALNVTPPTAVTQPPTPPVNPAPPGGARKEARQRQAAAQKSGADNAEEGEGSDGVDPSDAQNRVNPVDSAHQGSTRIEPGRETHPFTAVAHAEQPSAWSRGLLYGGGLTLAALVLAFGLTTARPTPRRRQPELPAPAYAKERRMRR